MSNQIKQLLLKPINFYVGGILFFALLYYILMVDGDFKLPNTLTWLAGVFALLAVWQCGFRTPYLGMTSMERLVQFHLLLTLPISETLSIIFVASLIMPFINKSYRMNSYHIALLRAFNNLGMNTIMLLSGYLVLNQGMILPIEGLGLHNFQVIAMAAVIMQAINISMIYFYFSFDKKKIYQLFTPAYVLADLVFVPVGVLSALLWQMSDPSLFALFAFFMLVLLITFYGFNKSDVDEDSMSINKGTEYQSTYLDLEHVVGAISSRCDQLFNCQSMFLIATEPSSTQSLFLIEINPSKDTDLPEFALKLTEQSLVEQGTQTLSSQVVSYMTAPFVDHNGVFAQLVLIRLNQLTYLNSDLNLLRLFVKRYRSGLSYAMTYSKLSEYKNNLELLVAERTQQLELVNKEKTQLVEKLKKISRSDALTTLHNRRYFDDLLKHMIANSPQLLSLAVVDIDHFKKVNDSYGHDVGDQVLRVIARIMKQWASPNSHLIRYGGEEFVIVNKHMAIKDAQLALTELIIKVAAYPWLNDGIEQAITVSVGLAYYPESDMQKLFEHADKALYQAKINGRNQLQLFE